MSRVGWPVGAQVRQWEPGNGVCVRRGRRVDGWGHGVTGRGGGRRRVRADEACRSSHRRSDASIACTVPGGTLPAMVPVCVRFEQRGCVRGGLSFQYMPNPVITAISPHRSHVR